MLCTQLGENVEVQRGRENKLIKAIRSFFHSTTNSQSENSKSNPVGVWNIISKSLIASVKSILHKVIHTVTTFPVATALMMYLGERIGTHKELNNITEVVSELVKQQQQLQLQESEKRQSRKIERRFSAPPLSFTTKLFPVRICDAAS